MHTYQQLLGSRSSTRASRAAEDEAREAELVRAKHVLVMKSQALEQLSREHQVLQRCLVDAGVERQAMQQEVASSQVRGWLVLSPG